MFLKEPRALVGNEVTGLHQNRWLGKRLKISNAFDEPSVKSHPRCAISPKVAIDMPFLVGTIHSKSHARCANAASADSGAGDAAFNASPLK